MSIASFKYLAKISLVSLSSLYSLSLSATIVEFETSQGNFKVNLHDQTTPQTVANFLDYINERTYENTVIHRVLPGFIIQGGGYQFEGDFPLNSVLAGNPIINEPIYSNVRATIAMAKISGNPDSATNQWFINYEDNSENLDIQNGGFTVFGEVIEDGMQVLDAISDLYLCSDIPMPDYTNELCSDNNYVPSVENFVTIHSVTIVDSSLTTADSLAGIKNTLINEPTETEPDSGSSGGAISYVMILALIALRFRRKQIKK